MVVAVKVIRAVKVYTESAKIETEILNGLKKKGGDFNYIVDLMDSFVHKNLGVKIYALTVPTESWLIIKASFQS
jgi:hypothetical protein